MLLAARTGSRAWPSSSVPVPPTAANGLAPRSAALLPDASRRTSCRGTGLAHSAPCASFLDRWLGGRALLAGRAPAASARYPFSPGSCHYRSRCTQASDTPSAAASVAVAAVGPGSSAAGAAALTGLATQPDAASSSGRHHHPGRPLGAAPGGALSRIRTKQGALSSCSSSSSTANGGYGRLSRIGSSSGSSSRGYGSGAWGAGGPGGGGFGGEPEGRGLPPPTIISPVALRVVVIGWMGSNRRYLNKYGGLWLRSGDNEVVIIRPTVAQTLVRWRGVVVAGRDIDRVARLHRENPAMPTVYHIFSTGGFIHAGTMWRWMDEVEDVAQRRDLLEEVKGIIFDSAPAAVNPAMASRAIVSAVTNTPAEELEYGMGGVQGALLDGTKAFLDSYLRSKGVQLRTEEVYDAWYNLAPVCPQLYLYSDADPLVPPADVERYMGVQEGRGVEVSSYKWPDSAHVDHFRRHPHEYAYQISAFLARALKDW